MKEGQSHLALRINICFEPELSTSVSFTEFPWNWHKHVTFSFIENKTCLASAWHTGLFSAVVDTDFTRHKDALTIPLPCQKGFTLTGCYLFFRLLSTKVRKKYRAPKITNMQDCISILKPRSVWKYTVIYEMMSNLYAVTSKRWKMNRCTINHRLPSVSWFF